MENCLWDENSFSFLQFTLPNLWRFLEMQLYDIFWQFLTNTSSWKTRTIQDPDRLWTSRGVGSLSSRSMVFSAPLKEIARGNFGAKLSNPAPLKSDLWFWGLGHYWPKSWILSLVPLYNSRTSKYHYAKAILPAYKRIDWLCEVSKATAGTGSATWKSNLFSPGDCVYTSGPCFLQRLPTDLDWTETTRSLSIINSQSTTCRKTQWQETYRW